LTTPSTGCTACQDYARSQPGLRHACASVGISRGLSSGETLARYLDGYHQRGHRREPSPTTGTPADCPYYRGVGTCMEGGMSCGFHGEPRCITDEPEGGWAAQAGTEPFDQPAHQGDPDGQ
jgi:hypothetical protein